MTDKLREDVERGKAAKEVFDNGFVQEAFGKIEDALYQTFLRSDPNDVAGRERVFLSMKLLTRFKEQFEFAIRTGNIAEKELLRIKDPNAFEKLMEKING